MKDLYGSVIVLILVMSAGFIGGMFLGRSIGISNATTKRLPVKECVQVDEQMYCRLLL